MCKILAAVASRIRSKLVSVSAAVAAAGVLVLVPFVFVGVLSRYLFNRPIAYVDEYSSYLLILITFLGLNYTMKTGGHISVDIITGRLPRKARNVLQVATHLVGLGLIVVLIILTGLLVAGSLELGTRADTLAHTPLAPIQLIFPIGLGLLAIEVVAQTIALIFHTKGKNGGRESS